MITLGIRSKPDSIAFAVYDTEESRLINVEKFKLPKALSTPESLKYLRNTILDILREYSVNKAGIRVTESDSRHLNVRRLQNEGVIQEAFASSSVQSYFCGQISTISSRIGFDRGHFKRYVDGELNYEKVENWDHLGKEEREAVFAAIGAANA